MTNLTILQLNDLHGYVEPHSELRRDAHGDFQFAQMGGLARIKTLFDQARQENPGGVIALDNGDTFHGTHFAVQDRARAMVPLINALGFDAMTLHWEFAYGPERVAEISGELAHPMLAANIFCEDSSELFMPPSTIIERNGVRVGIVGLACPIVDKTMPPSFSKGLRFVTGNAELPGHIERLRQDADLIVVLSHLGFPQDVQLAKDVAGIDVIVSGHTHNRMENAVVVNGAIIFQSGCHGSYVGRLDLDVSENGIQGWRHRLIPVDDSVASDPGLVDAVAAALASERQSMSEVVGHTDVALHRYAMLNSPMDDLLLGAIAEAAGTPIAFSNGWRYGAPIAPGPITMNDLWNMVPVDPPVSVVDVTGSEIREMLEENLERTFASDPYEQMGGYIKRMRGVRLVFKAENDKGRRIDRLYIDGAPIEESARYTAAFITAQGVPAKFGDNRRKLPISAIEALRRRLARPWVGAEDAESSSTELI